MKGKAQVIDQLTAESFGLVELPWYPQYGYLGGRSTFHWTVRVPKPYLITGSGTISREFEDKEKGQNVMETACEIPATFPWVIFGRFQKNQASYVGEDSKKTVIPSSKLPMFSTALLWLRCVIPLWRTDKARVSSDETRVS